MDDVLGWVEQHPWLAGAIGLGGLLILLWLLGFFSSSSTSSSSNQGNSLAAAYYNAEAAQTTAGTQLQMATEYYTNQTAQDQIQANGAEAIAATQAGMYTTLGQQNASASTTINAADNATAQAAYSDQLLASETSSADALTAANVAANYNYQTAQAQIAGQNYQALLGTTFGAVGPGQAATAYLPGAGDVSFSGFDPPANINTLEAMGYTPQGAAALTGLPFPGYTT